LNGAYVTWNEGYFQSKKSVFLLTGIRYTGSMPEAKAVADYCESRLKSAVAARFATLDAKCGSECITKMRGRQCARVKSVECGWSNGARGLPRRSDEAAAAGPGL